MAAIYWRARRARQNRGRTPAGRRSTSVAQPFERNAAFEHQAPRAVGGERRTACALPAGPTARPPVARTTRAIGVARRRSGSSRILARTIDRARGRGSAARQGRRMHDADERAPTRLSRALSRAIVTARASMSLASTGAQRLRRRDGEHAGAGADVEDLYIALCPRAGWGRVRSAFDPRSTASRSRSGAR